MIKHSHSIMHMLVAPLRWSSYMAALLQNLNVMSSERRVGDEMHWCALTAKSAFENVLIYPAFPEIFALLDASIVK